MKSVRNYLRRPIPATLRAQLENTAKEAHRVTNTYTGLHVSVEIHARNARNPNGYSASVDAAGDVKVSRSINLGWARRNGYQV